MLFRVTVSRFRFTNFSRVLRSNSSIDNSTRSKNPRRDIHIATMRIRNVSFIERNHPLFIHFQQLFKAIDTLPRTANFFPPESKRNWAQYVSRVDRRHQRKFGWERESTTRCEQKGGSEQEGRLKRLRGVSGRYKRRRQTSGNSR